MNMTTYMNRTAYMTYRCILVMVAMLLFHSCSNEVPDGVDEERIPLTFRVATLADISAGARGTSSDASSHALGLGVGVFVVSGEQYDDVKNGVFGKTYSYGYENVKYTYDSGSGGLQRSEAGEQMYCLSSSSIAVFAYAPYEDGMTLERLLTGKGGVSVHTEQSLSESVEASDFMLGTPSGSNPLLVSGADVVGSFVVNLDFRHQRSRLVMEMTPDWIYSALGGDVDLPISSLSLSSLKVFATNVPTGLQTGGNGGCYSLSADMKNFVYGGNADNGEILMAAFSNVSISNDSEALTMRIGGRFVDKLISTAIVFPFSISQGHELFRIEYSVVDAGSLITDPLLTKKVLLKAKSASTVGMGKSIIFRVGQTQSENDNFLIDSSGSTSPAI